jgi:hypothetical protein
MAPNVKSVSTQINQWWDTNCLAERRPDGTLRPRLTFSNLSTLHLMFQSGNDLASRHPAAAINSFLTATPNLVSLELEGFNTLRGELILPSRLSSLVLNMTLVRGIGLQAADHPASEPKKIVVDTSSQRYSHMDRDRLTPEFLKILSQSSICDTLVALDLSIATIRNVSVAAMGHFPALKLLGIHRKSFGSLWSYSNFLTDLVGNCRSLRGLMITGANGIPRECLMKFAQAASELRFPDFRMVVLVTWSYGGWDRLRSVAREPVPEMLGTGNVKLVLREGSHTTTAAQFERMEKDVRSL